MPDSDRFDELAEKHGRNRTDRLTAIKRWVEYIREQPPEVWGPEQNRLVDSQLVSARETDLSIAHERRVREFATSVSEDSRDE